MSRHTPADVTVIVPARDAARTIGATLASVLGAAPVAALQVIVVDDGSLDDTAANARSFVGVTVLATPQVGPGAARNVGVAAATTALVAFCDADDRWPPDRLTRDLDDFNSSPDLDLVLGRTRFDADDPGLIATLHFDSDDHTAVIPHFGAATVRRHLFDRTGPIIEHTTNYEDYDWFLRVREVGAVMLVHDRVAMFRSVHTGSMSRRQPPNPLDMVALLRRSVTRRKLDGVAARPLPSLDDIRTSSTVSDPTRTRP